jgi:hypothetical protein
LNPRPSADAMFGYVVIAEKRIDLIKEAALE